MIYIYEVVTKSINKSTKFVKCNFKDHIICQRLLPFHKDCLSLAFKFLKSTVLWEQTFLQYDFLLNVTTYKLRKNFNCFDILVQTQIKKLPVLS